MTKAGNWRTITVRPTGVLPTFGEQARHAVGEAKAAISGAAPDVETVDVSFGMPEAGWIEFWIRSGQQSVNWWLTNVSDPFALERSGEGDIEHTFLPWLERLVEGENPSLAVEMEGPWGVIVVTAGASAVRLSATTGGPAIALDISIGRLVFVDCFYRALVSFWESDAFGAAWGAWNFKGTNRWSMRSDVIEKALPALKR